jgi:hypothetical protein
MTGPYTVTDLLATMTAGPVRAGSSLARQSAPQATQDMLDAAFLEMQRAHAAGERRDWQAAEESVELAYGILQAAQPVRDDLRPRKQPLRRSCRDTL